MYRVKLEAEGRIHDAIQMSTTLHYITLQCVALRCVALCCVVLRYITSYHIKFHYYYVYYVTLYYVIIHYVTFTATGDDDHPLLVVRENFKDPSLQIRKPYTLKR